MATPYQIAAGIAGTREGQAALTDYLRTGGQNIDPTTRAWCADFVNATLTKAGQKGTDSGMARSFLKWGEAVVGEPQQGDIAVFSRGDPQGPYGHVGFFHGRTPEGDIQVLGGNQSDAVNISTYPADRLLAFRRDGPAPDTPAGGALAASEIQQPAPQQPETPAPFGGILAQTPFNLPQGVADFATRDDEGKGGILGRIGAALQQIPNAPAPNVGPMPDARRYGGILSEFLNQPMLGQQFARRRIG